MGVLGANSGCGRFPRLVIGCLRAPESFQEAWTMEVPSRCGETQGAQGWWSKLRGPLGIGGCAVGGVGWHRRTGHGTRAGRAGSP